MDHYPIISLNGELKPDTAVQFADFRGMFHGYGTYETVLVAHSCPRFLDDHLLRMIKGAHHLGIPVSWSRNDAYTAIAALITANQVTDAGLNIYLTTKNPYEVPLRAENTQALMMLRPINANYVNVPIALELRRERYTRSPLLRLKTLSSAHHVYERQHSRATSDAVLMDKAGYIMEATTANVWFIQGNTLLTPNSIVILSGTMRNTLMRHHAQFGYSLQHRPIHVSELEHFDEVFLTSSLRGVVRVASLSGTALKSGTQTEELKLRFTQEILNRN